MAFTIMTDSAANLPRALVEKYNILVAPLSYFIDGEQHTCLYCEDLDGEAFYRSIRDKDIKTAQTNPQGFIDLMEPVLKAGNDLVYTGLSSGISGSVASACIAMEHLKSLYPEREIYVVDSMGASLGEGKIVLLACECREKGMSLADTVALMRREVLHTCQIFTVDDLYYLRKGGRITGTVALVGTLLDIKPLLKGDENGHIVQCGKVRGRKRAIAAMAERYDRLVVEPEKQRVCIAHAACAADAAALEALLKKNRPPREILTVGYEPVTGIHVGLGTLALFFTGAADIREKT